MKLDKKNELLMRYKIFEQGKINSNLIKIFGENFVENNKQKCKIICEGKIYELTDYFDSNALDNRNSNILEIKLNGIDKITDASHMFSKCTSLISISGISHWNTINVTNMSMMFHGCSSLKFLPNISGFKMDNVTISKVCFVGYHH